ncbi:MAG TPA: SpoIID/LytB domain-containing protein [Blastocatellia bacterium]
MPAINRVGRARRRLARAAPVLCLCLALDGVNAAALGQKFSSDTSSTNRSEQNYRQSDDSGPTRPRRVGAGKRNDDTDGPIIRIGLMTDVASVSLSSSTALTIRRPAADNRDGRKTATAPVRVEIRQLPAADSREAIYMTKAAHASESQTRQDADGKSAKSKSQPRSTGASDRASGAPSTQRASQVVAIESGRVLASSEDRLIIAADEDESAHPGPSVRIGANEYRGEIHLMLNRRGKINVVNALPLERYLRGVVPMELPPGPYPAIEALKAQAVAARTYALAHRGQFREEGYDLRDDARSQVYAGLTGEQALTNRAVEETRGIVALYPGEDGKLSPIEAVYTANCGGRTENNEEVFGGKPLPYLRSVACSPDRLSLAAHDITSNRATESIVGADGRLITREVALFEVLGFALPRRVTGGYLRGAADASEVKNWAERAARLTQKGKLQSAVGDVTRVHVFASLVSSAIYGDNRASLMLTPADVDYILAGFGASEAPQEVRACVALLLREGILRLPADGTLDARAPVTRGYAIETLARAFYLKLQPAWASDLKSQTAQAAENGRLIIASSAQADRQGRQAADAKPGTGEINHYTSREATARKGPSQDRTTQGEPGGFEIDKNAWLFRSIAGESYAVDHLRLIGGERVKYHLNAAGRVDFIEAAPSERGAASDRFSTAAQWRERVSAEEMRRRLLRSRIDVGDVEEITPVTLGTSSRVLELEVSGPGGRSRLRGSQIRNALGLKENLFVVDREMDSRGRVTAFVFTGRGWGHGVGMCQTGAYGLAKEGYSYTAILQKYYTNVRVQKVY